MTKAEERKLLLNQTLEHRHPQQYVMFSDPAHVHLDFSKPTACDLLKHQEVSEQRELGLKT